MSAKGHKNIENDCKECKGVQCHRKCKRSHKIAWIGRGNIEGSREGRNMLKIGRKCRRESRDDVGRQSNVKLSSN